MTQQEIDKQASESLLNRAVHSSSLTCANLLLDSAYRLDNTIPLDYYRQVVRNNWQIAEYSKRMELIK